MTETDLKNRVKAALRNKYPGIYIRKFNDRFTSGILDMIVIWRGVHIWIELKVQPNKPTPLQLYEIKKIQEAGGYAVVCYSVDEVMEAVKNV